MITMNQTHSKKFHCTYLLHYYPFDSQVNLTLCVLQLFIRRAFKILLKNEII